MAHRSSCKSRRVSFSFLDQMKLNFNVYMVTRRIMTLMSKMMLMTMTMMTVGHRYEYTRSNDRMWRKNTVGFVTMTTILIFFLPITSFQNQKQTPTWISVWNFHFRWQTPVQPVLESIWIETFLKGNFRWRCQLNSIAGYGDRYRARHRVRFISYERIYMYCSDTRLDDTNNVGALCEIFF